MENKPKTFVGILIMTKIKLSENSPEELVALLQRRGKINDEHESGFNWQSFPGLCEITAYGKAEENEDVEIALEREIAEELGEKTLEMIKQVGKEKIFEHTNDKGEKYFIFASLLPIDIFKTIQLDISTGGIEIVKKSDLENIESHYFGKEKITIKDLDNITLWELPVSVLQKAFEIFS